MKLEQPEQKTNRMQRPAGSLGSEPGRVRGAAWLAPGTPHNQDRGRSAPRCGHRSPKPDAHWSPRLPAGKSLNWAHRRAGEKDPVPPAGGREAAVAGWGHPKPGSCGAHTETRHPRPYQAATSLHKEPGLPANRRHRWSSEG